MTSTERQFVGRAYAETYIAGRVPGAVNFSWSEECKPPNQDFDVDIVSFNVRGVLMQLRLRCDALDGNNQQEIRGWVQAQLRGSPFAA